MAGKLIRLAGVFVAIGSVIGAAVGVNSDSAGMLLGCLVVGLPGGLLMFAAGRVIADIFGPQQKD